MISVDKIEREVPVMVGGRSSKVAVVDEEKCTLCEWCPRVCFHEAISLEEYPEIDEEKCEACGLCVSVCPSDAITIEKK
jgi:ferredoxin